MSRVAATDTDMKIEHWRCQSRNAHLELTYSNLLAACWGGEGQPGPLQHCDTRKGEQDVKFNPADRSSSIEGRIQYAVNGTISSTDVDYNAQLNEVLNLNLKLLKNRRKGVIDGLLAWLREYSTRHHRGADTATLQRKRTEWAPATGSLKPFSGVAVWWLDRGLARRST
jgi:uncharacterized protein (TIGR02646 family)